MSITIEQKNGGPKYIATTEVCKTQYESDDGFEWTWVGGGKPPSSHQDDLRRAMIQYLDTTAEPQQVRAEVGDWITPTSKEHGKFGQAFKVTSTEAFHDRVWIAGDEWFIDNNDYTIVPDPTPKEYTGNPEKDKWGEGCYVDNNGHFVVVHKDGPVVFLGDRIASELPENFPLSGSFRRIFTNPTACLRDGKELWKECE